MILLRRVLILSAFGFLAACEPAPIVEPGVSATIVPRNIVVDTSQIAGVEGRDIEISAAQVKSDLEPLLRAALEQPGTPNADVFVTVTKVTLIARGASVAFLQSNVQAVLQVKDAASGADILAPTAITGNSENLRLAGAVGVILAPEAEEDYRQTLRGFAASVRARIFGADADA